MHLKIIYRYAKKKFKIQKYAVHVKNGKICKYVQNKIFIFLFLTIIQIVKNKQM